MKFFDKLFGRSPLVDEAPSGDDESIVIVPIPPLAVMLHKLEEDKGLPLTEDEVLEARDKAACITMTVSHRDQLAEKRGYRDVDLENVWQEWQDISAKLQKGAD